MYNSTDGELINGIEIDNKTVIRVLYDDIKQNIKEMEIIKIVSSTDNTFKLSNGITISKGCLFPYHRKNYRRGEEYYFLDKFII